MRTMRDKQCARGTGLTDLARLARDVRGGTQMVAYVMIVAGIGIVAIAGARALDHSDRATFKASTLRFDRPGTYVGGTVQHGAGGGAIGPGGDDGAGRTWTEPEVEDVVIPDGDVQAVALTCDYATADDILAAGFKAWCKDGGCINPNAPDPAEWSYYWCEIGAPARDRCSANPSRSEVDQADRNYRLARRALRKQLHCDEDNGPISVDNPAEGYGWRNIACYWTSPEYLKGLYSCLPPGWKPPKFPPIPGGPIGPPPYCQLPMFDPSVHYCRPLW